MTPATRQWPPEGQYEERVLNLRNNTHYSLLRSLERMKSFWVFALTNREGGCYQFPGKEIHPRAVTALEKIFVNMGNFPPESLVLHLRDKQFESSAVKHNPSFTAAELECILVKWDSASI